MSYDIELVDEKDNKFELPYPIEAGGTYQVGGTQETELNVTYNYCKHFNFRDLENKKAKDTIKDFEEAIKKLKDDVNPDYWAPTEGNAKTAIKILYGFAKLYPEGTWKVY